MSILDKIEEARKKPEYIRRRYVWIGVFISMIFVMIIWIFSFKLTVKPVKIENQESDNLKKNIEEAKNQMSSIKEMLEGAGLESSEKTSPLGNEQKKINPDSENSENNPAGNEGNEVQSPANNTIPLEQEGIIPNTNQR